MENKILSVHKIKKTKPRVRILKLLRESNSSLSVFDIVEKLEDIDQSTVYRTLALFENENLIVKVLDEKLNTNVYKYVDHKHSHFLKCLGCNKIFEIEYCPMDFFLENNPFKDSFKVTSYTFEIYGYCESCYKDNL